MHEYGLLFYFSEDFTESDVLALKQAINEIVLTGEWPGQPPELIDKTDVTDSDEPIRTVGGFVPLPSPDPKLDRHNEQACYEAVKRLVDVLSLLTEKTGCEFELELDGTYVGDISHGKPDKLVTVGLLEEWRKHLG